MHFHCLLTALTAGMVSAADLNATSVAELRAAGATIHGALSDASAEGRDGIAFGTDMYATLPTSEHFDPSRGSVEMWVRPEWAGDATERHTFFHIGENDARSHVTLFKTEGPTVRFVYKSSPDAFLAVDLPCGEWQPGEWRRLTATWLAFGGRMAVGLRIDDGEPKWAMGGAPLADVPELLYIGRRGPAPQFAVADLSAIRLTGEAMLSPPYAAGPKAPLAVDVDCSRPGGPIPRVHDCVTIWNRLEKPLPFEQGDTKHRRLREAGFKLARLVACSETWLTGIHVTRNGAGEIQLDFTDFDRLADLVKSAGLDIYLRIAYHMPRELSAEPDSPNWAYSGPRDWDEWSAYVRAVVKHCNIDRDLGVKYWVMSVNEADIAVDRHGADWDTICRLYEASARAGKSVDPSIKVGGPAICKPLDGTGGDALRRFVSFCRDRDVPLDFICFHRYHVPHPRDFEVHINAVREIVREANPDLEPEYILDEWSQWARDRHADDEYGAAYLAAALQYFRRAGLSKASVVSFNDNMLFVDEDVDLIVHQGPFPKTDSETARFLAGELESDGVKRRCIVSHAPGKGSYTFGRYEVDVPAGRDPRLALGTGITARYETMDGVGFAIVVRTEETEKVVFDHYQRKGAWQEHEVSLADYAGDSVVIELRTDRGREPDANTAADWASWAEPRIETGPADAAEVAFDFIELIDRAETGVHQVPTKFTYSDEAIVKSSGLPLIKSNVVTAPYFVFLAQSELTGGQLPVEGLGEGGIDDTETAGVLAARDGDTVRALLWTFDLMGAGEREVRLRFADAPEGDLRVRHYLIDATHTNAYHDYIIEGKPADEMYNIETAELECVSDEPAERDREGRMTVELTLPDFSVSLVEVALTE